MAKFADLVPGIITGLGDFVNKNLEAEREQENRIQQLREASKLNIQREKELAPIRLQQEMDKILFGKKLEASLLEGAAGNQQSRKLEQIEATQAAKVKFDPQLQAQSQALETITGLFQQPELSLSPDAPEAGANRLRDLFQERSRYASQGKLQALQESGLLPKPAKDIEAIFAESEARSLGTASGTAKREEIKDINSANDRLRELDIAIEGVNNLFDTADTKLPSITGRSATPGILPFAKGLRGAGLATGFEEEGKGFINTFPVKARKLLRVLEKGGRFTDKDIVQIVAGAIPGVESAVARKSKREELIRDLKEEKRLTTAQLSIIRQGDSNIKAESKLSFSSISEAESANLPPGTIITINGRRARVD